MAMISFRRMFIIVGIFSLLISYLGIWTRMISSPAERTGADFIHFYSAGRIAQIKGASHVYNLELQHDMEEVVVGFSFPPEQLLPYNHLPFLIPLLQAIVNSNYVESFYRWTFILILTFSAGILVLNAVLKQTGIAPNLLPIVYIASLLFLPFFFSLMNGQDTAFVFLGMAVWVYGMLTGKHMLAGLGLSLVLVRPHIALVLAIPMFFSYRNVFVGFICGTALLITLSISILGIQGSGEFVNIILLSAVAEGYGIKPDSMFNLIGLLTRSFPFLEAEKIRTLGWMFYGLSILGLVLLWVKYKGRYRNMIGLTVIISLFSVPHLYFHDLALLLIPIFDLVCSEKLKASIAIIVPIAISLLLLLSNISYYLQYSVPYLIMLALIWYPLYAEKKTISTALRRS